MEKRGAKRITNLKKKKRKKEKRGSCFMGVGGGGDN